jgi:phage tail sheath gpL-like
LPAGITSITPAAGVSGATDPAMADAITAIGDVQYHTIAHAFTDATNLTAIEDELATRWGPMVQTEGHSFTAAKGSQGTLTTLGNTRNSPHSTIFGTGLSPTPPWVAAAIAAAVDARETQIDPLRPRQTLHLQGMLPPAPEDRFTRAERNTLLTDGISTFTVDSGGRCLVERLITTYQSNASAVPDITFLDVTKVRGLAYLRFSLRARITSRYPRHKLASDGTQFAPGQAIVTPSSIRAEILVWFRQLEFNGYVEGYDQFAEDLIVERDGTDPDRVNALLSPDLVNKFIVFAGQIQFLQ